MSLSRLRNLAAALAISAALFGGGVTPVLAADRELKPFENYSVHFGSVSGSVYVDRMDAGSHIVATFAGGEDATPVRFVTTLAPGQETTVSVPRGPGEAAMQVTVVRRGDRVFVQDNDIVGSVR